MTVAPDPVTNLTAKADLLTIHVSWTPSPNAEGYLIHRRTPSASTMTYYADQAAPNFTDTVTETGYHFYAVYPYVMNNGEMVLGQSNGYTFAEAFTAPSPVTNLSVSSSGTTARLSWSPVPDVDGFAIYRRTPSATGMTFYKDVQTSSFDDQVTEEGYHFYMVRPYRIANGQRYLGSSTGYVYTLVTMIPPPVRDLKVTSTESTARLSWTQIPEAEGYLIYRQAPSGTSMSYLTAVTASSYEDVVLEPGYFFYFVYPYKTVSGIRIVGEKSNFASILVTMAPAPITNLTVNSSESIARLRWSPVADADGYAIYRRTPSSPYFSYRYIVTSPGYNDSISEPGYYFYRVFPYKMINGQRVMGRSTTYAYTNARLEPLPVKNLTAKSMYDKAQISWTPSSGATGYAIYGQTPSGTGMTYLGDATTNQFEERVLEPGFHFYMVRPYREVGGQRFLGRSTGYVYTYVTMEPMPVTNLRATSEKNNAEISWTKTDDADGYYIFRMKPGESSVTYYGYTAGNTFKDSDIMPGFHYYRVYPYRMVNGERIVGQSTEYVYTWWKDVVSELAVDKIYWPKLHEGTRSSNVRAIVIHHAAGVMSTDGLASYLQSPGDNRLVNANYAIGNDGGIACVLPEDNRPWTTGTYGREDDVDDYSITFEVANSAYGSPWPISNASMRSVINLVADIGYRYEWDEITYTGDGSGRLLMHKWYRETSCPEAYLSSRFGYIRDEANKLLRQWRSQ